MKEFDEHNKKKYEDSIIIPTYQSSSISAYPKHYDETSNADSGDTEDTYVPYDGYEYVDGPSTVPEADGIQYYDIYMEA